MLMMMMSRDGVSSRVARMMRGRVVWLMVTLTQQRMVLVTQVVLMTCSRSIAVRGEGRRRGRGKMVVVNRLWRWRRWVDGGRFTDWLGIGMNF